MTSTALDLPRLDGRALLLSNADAFIHVARRATREGLDKSLCGYAEKQLRLMYPGEHGSRSYVLCPNCMLKALAR